MSASRGPVAFMSDGWCELFRHAVEEAERLGLQITLNAGPGWTGSGGPWVKAEQSMQHLVAAETNVTGPTHFDAVLPRPAPRDPYFGAQGLPDEMLRAREDFYADVAVLAVPQTDAAVPHQGPRREGAVSATSLHIHAGRQTVHRAADTQRGGVPGSCHAGPGRHRADRPSAK